MPEYKIVLKPVYFKTVETLQGIEIPGGWRLAWHQLEIFKALCQVMRSPLDNQLCYWTHWLTPLKTKKEAKYGSLSFINCKP